MSECVECRGTGYIIREHKRKTCFECEGKGIITPLLIDYEAKKEKQSEEAQALADERRTEEIEELIDDKEAEIEDLEDELWQLQNELTELYRKRNP